MTRETALWEAWRASAEIYRQRIRAMDSRTVRDGEDDVLGAGHTHGTGEGSFVEPYVERKIRRAQAAAAAQAVEYPNPRHIPKNHTVTLISREEAIARGLTRYFTGERCVHGHLTERIVSTRTCVECHRLHQLNSKTERGREARRQAKAEGKTRYFSEQKCPRGHVGRAADIYRPLHSVPQHGCREAAAAQGKEQVEFL